MTLPQFDRNFMIDLTAGEQAEIDLVETLKKKLNRTKWFQKVPHDKYPYDLRVTLEREDGSTFDRTIEVKTLAGGYPTAVVEVWADDLKKKRPKWHHPDVDIIVFRDESRKRWFLYDCQKMIRYLHEESEGCHPLTRCRNGNDNSSGWIHRFEWENSDMGFITAFGE